LACFRVAQVCQRQLGFLVTIEFVSISFVTIIVVILTCFEPWLTGNVVSYEHAIPRGGLFDHVSCPHYLMEIIIYLAFLLIGGYRHVTLLSIVIFVVTNQLVAGYLTHRWYRTHFGALYPAQRKAVIPFVL